MRDLIVAGNWKMNKTFDDGIGLIRDLMESITEEIVGDAKVIVSPPYVLLSDAVAELWENEYIAVAAQNCHQEKEGAYTGEVSAEMLRSIDVDAVIIGHSERRQYYKESNAQIAQKVDQALSHELVPIFCCGELLEERKADQHFDVVKTQIQEALFHLPEEQFKHVVIAYEPVWAIGTGETASPEQAQEIHAYIREVVSKKYGEAIAEDTSILYGGSCKPSNAKELFANPDVDGGLIGGAALNASDFTAIVEALKVKK